jgi:hypothetical protein
MVLIIWYKEATRTLCNFSVVFCLIFFCKAAEKYHLCFNNFHVHLKNMQAAGTGCSECGRQIFQCYLEDRK